MSADAGCDQPLIRRLKTEDRSILDLDAAQAAALAAFRAGLSDGTFTLAPNPCLCCGIDDTLIACRDRYGLSVRTVLCNRCGLMRTDPYLEPTSLQEFYRRDYRAIYREKDFSLERFFVAQQAHGVKIENFVRQKVKSAGTVFEVGCGAGGILDAFRARGWQVAGCDFGQEYLAYGCERGLPLVQGDATSLSQFGKADLVVLSHVIEHFRDPLSELGKIRRLMGDTGLLYVEVPGLFWIQNSYRNADIRRYLQNAHAYHFCLESLEYVMLLAGFARVTGDEKIESLFTPSNREPLLPKGLAARTTKFLRWLERERYVATLKSYVPMRVQIGLSTIKQMVVRRQSGADSGSNEVM